MLIFFRNELFLTNYKFYVNSILNFVCFVVEIEER
jgi:hypothetical protein